MFYVLKHVGLRALGYFTGCGFSLYSTWQFSIHSRIHFVRDSRMWLLQGEGGGGFINNPLRRTEWNISIFSMIFCKLSMLDYVKHEGEKGLRKKIFGLQVCVYIYSLLIIL